MVNFADLPSKLDDYENFIGQLEFPFLHPNSSKECPVGEKGVDEYAEAEATIEPRNLRFVRTANVDDINFWVWEDAAPTGDVTFVSVESYQGSVLLSCQWAAPWLTVEKYLAWRYASSWR